jgi:hypothetical protein
MGPLYGRARRGLAALWLFFLRREALILLNRCTALPVLPNVRAKLPAEACSVSLVCEGAEGAAHQAYAACRSGSA